MPCVHVGFMTGTQSYIIRLSFLLLVKDTFLSKFHKLASMHQG